MRRTEIVRTILRAASVATVALTLAFGLPACAGQQQPAQQPEQHPEQQPITPAPTMQQVQQRAAAAYKEALRDPAALTSVEIGDMDGLISSYDYAIVSIDGSSLPALLVRANEDTKGHGARGYDVVLTYDVAADAAVQAKGSLAEIAGTSGGARGIVSASAYGHGLIEIDAMSGIGVINYHLVNVSDDGTQLVSTPLAEGNVADMGSVGKLLQAERQDVAWLPVSDLSQIDALAEGSYVAPNTKTQEDHAAEAKELGLTVVEGTIRTGTKQQIADLQGEKNVLAESLDTYHLVFVPDVALDVSQDTNPQYGTPQVDKITMIDLQTSYEKPFQVEERHASIALDLDRLVWPQGEGVPLWQPSAGSFGYVIL